jgi:hypothetical protein
MCRTLLGFILSLWMKAAVAGVSCSLPFTLVNGTTADATQVMANYNALVACLGNAANAGANSDITSLLGLTTPLVYTAGGSSTYIGGTSTGPANAYVIASPVPNGFSLTNGKVISFIANISNTGPTQINVNGLGLVNLFRQTASGAVAMLGGEIVTGQIVVAMYDGTEFQCLNCAQTSLVPTGTVLDFSGPIIPTGFLQANGQIISRTVYANLFNALAYTSVSATTINTSTSVVVPNSALFQIGWYVGGNNVTCNTYITSIPDGTHIVIQNAAGAGGSTTLTIGPYQQGDCSTTFHTPNYTGKLVAGVDGSTNITASTCPNAASIGDKTVTPNTACGAQTVSLGTTNLPAYTPSGSVSTSIIQGGSYPSMNGFTTPGTNVGVGGTATGGNEVSLNGLLTASSTFTGNAQGGTSAPINKLPPVSLVYKIIKL